MEEEVIHDYDEEKKLYKRNPTIVTEIGYSDLKSNHLTTAGNVTDMVTDFVMPKLYLLFGVLCGLFFITLIIVWFVCRKKEVPGYEYMGGGGQMLNGVITKNGF